MACPTCDHTMQNVGAVNDRIFWCPRCGTLRTCTGDHKDDEVTYFMRRINDIRLESTIVNGIVRVHENPKVH